MSSSDANLLPTFPSSSAATSSFLPLTTVCPVPTSCFDELYTAFFTTEGITAFRDYWAARSECYPESYGEFEYPTIHAGSSWYSPGVCPSGYPIASSYYDYEASATRAWCCPGPQDDRWVPEFPWGGDGGRRVCINKVTTSTSLVLAERTTIITDYFMAYDWPISVMWAQSDLMRFTPMSAPVLVTAASTASPSRPSGTSILTSSATRPPSPTATNPSPGPSDLSTGAKAGIGVGAAILVLGLLAAGLIFYRRRNAQPVQPVRPPADFVWAVPAAEIDEGKSRGHHSVLSEMGSNDTWIPQHTDRAELDGHALNAYKPHRPNI